MIQVSIKKQNVITNQAYFSTPEQAQAWLNQEIANGSFGKLERWVRENQEDISNALETRTIVDMNQEIMEYRLAAEFTIEQQDLTVQVQAEQDRQVKIESGKKAREACQSVLDYMAGTNLDKELTIEQITQMQATFANAESALRAGRPTYAKMFISVIVPDGIIVTTEEKVNCLSLLQDY